MRVYLARQSYRRMFTIFRLQEDDDALYTLNRVQLDISRKPLLWYIVTVP